MSSPMTEVLRTTVSICGTTSQALLDEVAQRDPELRRDVDRALNAGAALEFSVTFADNAVLIGLGIRGANGVTANIATISTVKPRVLN